MSNSALSEADPQSTSVGGGGQICSSASIELRLVARYEGSSEMKSEVWRRVVEMVGEQRGWMVGVRFCAGRDVSRWDDTRSARRPREIFGVGFGEDRRGSGQGRAPGRAGQRNHAAGSLLSRTGWRAGRVALLAQRALWFNAYGKGLRADQGPTSEEPLSASASAAGRKWSEVSWLSGSTWGGAGGWSLGLRLGGSMETCSGRRGADAAWAWARAKKDCSVRARWSG